MQILDWIDRVLEPRQCNSEKFMYDDMESQSGRDLPIIYEPFDIARRVHWTDRGALFDFMCATEGWEKKILDFGPGDGWPSLIVAPFVGEVIGADGSRKRCEVCRENAARLGMENVTFEQVVPGDPLPYQAATFDGVMAASSIEQTPDPRATLEEIHRVLKPGGRLRISYEDLERYRNGGEQEVDLEDLGGGRTSLIVYDRHIDDEFARMYSLTLSVPREEALTMFSVSSGSLSSNSITVRQFEQALPFIVDARTCRLTHPSGSTLARWLEEIGFSRILPTHSGIRFAGRLFDSIPRGHHPRDLAGLDRLLRPLVGIIVGMAAPLDSNPMITAVK